MRLVVPLPSFWGLTALNWLLLPSAAGAGVGVAAASSSSSSSRSSSSLLRRAFTLSRRGGAHRQPDDLYFPLERFGAAHEVNSLPIEPSALESEAAVEAIGAAENRKPEETAASTATEPPTTIVVPEQPADPQASAPEAAAPVAATEPQAAQEPPPSEVGPKAKVVRGTGPVPWDKEGVQSDKAYKKDYLHDKQPEAVEGSVPAGKIVAENQPRSLRETMDAFDAKQGAASSSSAQEEVQPSAEQESIATEAAAAAPAVVVNQKEGQQEKEAGAEEESSSSSTSSISSSSSSSAPSSSFTPFGWDTGEIQNNKTYGADYPVDDQPGAAVAFAVPKAD